MTKEIRRVYVYNSLFKKIMKWGERAINSELIKAPPNNRNNFPYFLEQYIKHIKPSNFGILR